MRRSAVLLLFAGSAWPCLAVKNVTVEQLEQLLVGAHDKPDVKVAELLSEVALTERLNAGTFSSLNADLPGPEARQALTLLADVSVFFPPSMAEAPTTAPPSVAEQRRILTLAVDHVAKTITKLPNFFATREMVRYENSLKEYRLGGSLIPSQPLHAVGKSSDNVLYRSGKEVVDAVAVNGKASTAAQGLTSSGVFGPIMTTVLVDADHGSLSWSRWEQGPTGKQAVFRYSVPKEKSQYRVNFCCVAGTNNNVFSEVSAYHGVIVVDPASGVILRLTLQADLPLSVPVLKSDLSVEYGPVEIGGKSYVCPTKSVSIVISRPLDSHGNVIMTGLRPQPSEIEPSSDHLKVWLTDVKFSQYHVFRSDSHLLARNDEAIAPTPSDFSTESKPSPKVMSATTEDPAPTTAVDKPPPAVESASPAMSRANDSRPSTPAFLEARGSTLGLPASEITVAAATELPNSPSQASPDATFSLRVSARLVDVGVVAYDKKGHPLVDMRPEDFEVYDDGRKQAVRFFARTTDAAVQTSAEAPAGSSLQPESAYSNRRESTGAGSATTNGTERNTTILLIDASNLANSDLTNARRQILSFLRSLDANEQVGLYILQANGFQVLQDRTADHALLATKLTRWTPSARDAARAQEEESRNRQQIDTVSHASDLQSVNGNISSTPETAETIDPQLRDEGNNAGGDSLSMLTNVARHLAAIPGHKNLVWVTSDNVLADWSNQSVGSDKGGKNIGPAAIRAQETMNDAHVAVYPLDASQLETMAVDAGLQNRNVELSPSITTEPQAQSGGAQGGRITAEMQQDVHSIQGPMVQLAAATGGRAIGRAGDLTAALNTIVADGRATYLLSFTPDQPADGRYHRLTVKLVGRKGVNLHYRTGYLYTKEPDTLKDRVRLALAQPLDVNDIGVSANPVETPLGATLKLKIATKDIDLTQQDERWVGKLDIFLVQREDVSAHARVSGQVIALKLLPATYQEAVASGVPFDQLVAREQRTGSIRVVIVDESSGRIGSVTVPATAMQGKWH